MTYHTEMNCPLLGASSPCACMFEVFAYHPSTECMPNGTIEAIAIKVEAVPSLDLQQLSLNDPSCGPTYSDDHFALFLFRVDSCGTTREASWITLVDETAEIEFLLGLIPITSC